MDVCRGILPAISIISDKLVVGVCAVQIWSPFLSLYTYSEWILLDTCGRTMLIALMWRGSLQIFYFVGFVLFVLEALLSAFVLMVHPMLALRFEISCFLLSEDSHRLLVFCPPCSRVYFSSSHFTSMLKVWSFAPAHRIYYCKILFLVEFVIKLFEKFKLTWHCTGLMCDDSKYTTTLEALEKQQNWSEWQHKALLELPSEELELLGTGGFLDLQLSCLW